MNIGHIGGNGGVERSSDRPARTEGKRATDTKSVDAQDRSSISDSGRETAAAIGALAERAKSDDPERKVRIEVALQKLMNGNLSSDEAHRQVAERMLATGFITG